MKIIKGAFLLFAVAGLAFSCSDDETEAAIPSTALPMVTKITTDGTHDRVYKLTYDSARRITKINVTGDAARTYTFSYTPDNLIASVAVDAISDVNYVFHYNENLIYTGFTATPGGDSAASYDEVTKTYDLTTTFGNEVHIKPDSDSDIVTIHDFDDEDPVTFVYDSTVKGPFYNAVGNIHFVMSLLDEDFMYFATRKAPLRASMNAEQEYYKYINIAYDSFVEQTILTAPDMNLNIDYDYTWL